MAAGEEADERDARAGADAPGEDAASCEEVQGLLAVFAVSRLGEEQHKRLRAHLIGCEPCRQDYRHAVSSLAEVSRAIRERRIAPPESREKERTRRARVAIARVASARRGNRFSLRLFVTTAALIFLFTFLVSHETDSLTVRWGTGAVTAAEHRLGPGQAEFEVEAGDWCLTEPDGRATIEGGGLTAQLAGDTAVLIEDPDTARLRLLHGTLEVTGTVLVLSASAVVEVDGRARFENVGGALATDCLEGSLVLIDASGEWELAAGESLSVDARAGLLVRD